MNDLNNLIDLCAGIVSNKNLPTQRNNITEESFDPLKIGFEFCDVDIYDDLIYERYISSNKHILYLIYNTSYKLQMVRLQTANGIRHEYNVIQRIAYNVSFHTQITQWLEYIL
jgi:hypothetical protein